MLIAALIFVISLATVIQFAVLSWRAALLKLASEPLPPQYEAAAEMQGNSAIPSDFVKIMAYSKLCPDLGERSAPTFWRLRVYYKALQVLQELSRTFMPESSAWTGEEMALCTRCAAAMLARHLDRTQAVSAVARSF